MKVLCDGLDRWASSRSIWNQHAYSITNIADDGTVPKTSEWMANWKQKGLHNLYEDKVCAPSEAGVALTATVCNRGKKAVGADMPATFYKGEAGGEILCVSYTQGPVPVGGCLDVSCETPGAVSGKVTMVVNDDGNGGMTTVECNADNNTDSIGKCEPK